MQQWWERLEWWFWKQRTKRRWNANLVSPSYFLPNMINHRAEVAEAELADIIGRQLYGK